MGKESEQNMVRFMVRRNREDYYGMGSEGCRGSMKIERRRGCFFSFGERKRRMGSGEIQARRRSQSKLVTQKRLPVH